MKTYPINEAFCSLQGEGFWAGAKRVFLRFQGCNLKCSIDGDEGFDCDTEFTSGNKMTFVEISQMVQKMWSDEPHVVLTGGEPLLHLDYDFFDQAHKHGWTCYIETNGTRSLMEGWPDGKIPFPLPWVSCSPKTAEHSLRVGTDIIDELRYVRNHTQSIPRPALDAEHYWLSPAWSDDRDERDHNLQHCIKLVKQNPGWRLSVQQHKQWKVQ